MTTRAFQKFGRFLESARTPQGGSDRTRGVPLNSMFDQDVGPRFLGR